MTQLRCLLAFLIFLPWLMQCGRLPPEPLKTRIAVSQTPLSSAFFIADISGYFTQCGVAPELIAVNGGKRAFDLMDQGLADFSTSSDSVVSYAVQQEKSFHVFASFASSENDVKVISRSPELTRQIQTIGYWSDTASEHLLQTYLALYPVESEFEMQSHPPESLVTRFREGSLDAISVWEPFAWQLSDLLESGEAFLLDTEALHSLHFMLLGSENTPESDELAFRILAALQLATIDIYQQPEQSQALIRQRMKADASFIDWIWSDYLFQIKPATSIRFALLSNSRWLNAETSLDYQPYLTAAEQLQSIEELPAQWCGTS